MASAQGDNMQKAYGTLISLQFFPALFGLPLKMNGMECTICTCTFERSIIHWLSPGISQ